MTHETLSFFLSLDLVDVDVRTGPGCQLPVLPVHVRMMARALTSLACSFCRPVKGLCVWVRRSISAHRHTKHTHILETRNCDRSQLTHLHTRTHTHTHARTHATVTPSQHNTHSHTRTRVTVHTHTHTHTRTHARMHARTHARTHTQTHIKQLFTTMHTCLNTSKLLP